MKLYDSRCSKRMIIHLRDTYITRIVFLLNHSKRYNSTGRINCFKLYGSLNTKGDTLIAYRLPITFSFTFTAGSPSLKKVMFIVYSCSPWEKLLGPYYCYYEVIDSANNDMQNQDTCKNKYRKICFISSWVMYK